MSNTYLKTAFALVMSSEDAALIQAAFVAADLLEANSEDDELRRAFDDLGPAFAAAFPPQGASGFGSFAELFDDPDFPSFDCRVDVGEADEQGRREVAFSGEQFGVEQVARLIFTACKSALPCAFAWSYDCDRLRVGEFGGGCVVITASGIDHHTTTGIIDRAITREIRDPDEAVDGYVLAIRDREHGLSFWSNEEGFGRLALATVFSEDEAATFDKPIADDEPEWLTMPAPLRP